MNEQQATGPAVIDMPRTAVQVRKQIPVVNSHDGGNKIKASSLFKNPQATKSVGTSPGFNFKYR